MGEQMEAIVWDGSEYPGGLSYRAFPRPAPGPGWVLVHNRAAGICGSDLHYLLGRRKGVVPPGNLPAVLGHENAGVVVEVGPGVTSVTPGDRVAVEPLHGCIEFGGSCPMCRVGQYQLCLTGLAHVGVPRVRMLPGGYGEYSVVHATRLFPIPEDLGFAEAAMLDVLAVGVHAVNVGRPAVGSTAVVLGCGVIGLDVVQCLRVAGVSTIIAVAKYGFQAEAARRLGAADAIEIGDTSSPQEAVRRVAQGVGADQVYECVGGASDGVNLAIGMCRPGGTIVVLGGFTSRPALDLAGLQRKEIALRTSNSYSTAANGVREYATALDLLHTGRVDHASLATHTFAPERYREAIDAAIGKGAAGLIKGLFVRE
jgi:threonine dehydrogenase-like Zn-dependent dehydrogenase